MAGRGEFRRIARYIESDPIIAYLQGDVLRSESDVQGCVRRPGMLCDIAQDLLSDTVYR